MYETTKKENGLTMSNSELVAVTVREEIENIPSTNKIQKGKVVRSRDQKPLARGERVQQRGRH